MLFVMAFQVSLRGYLKKCLIIIESFRCFNFFTLALYSVLVI